MNESDLLNRTIFIGGPPRSGTTFATKSLNQHPHLVAAIDDHVYENWGLYHYRDRSGLVQELRTGHISPDQVKQNLANYLFTEHHLLGAAPSSTTTHCSQVSQIATPYAPTQRSPLEKDRRRFDVPVQQFSADIRLCLKSPEITHVLPQLAHSFPDAKFVLVYRPVYEIAESMFRIGNIVTEFPVFHQRWLIERNPSGLFIPPPGVPLEWNRLWQSASDFKRCVIYAASYLRAMIEGTQELSPDRYLVYDHAHLRDHPEQVFQQLALFLDVDVAPFQVAQHQLNSELPFIHPQLLAEYQEIELELELTPLMQKIQSLILTTNSR